MLPHQRRMQIASIVKQSGDMTVDQLAQKLQVSASTIRRDLSLLDREGMLTRVRGGVIESDANPFVEVAAYAQEEKQRIARL
ncbi:MAG: DeoR family transcriptional regulator, partial [Varibaculum cambriense]|nr:DeoR family transcriptional regulator [Varibaculum cambriense]